MLKGKKKEKIVKGHQIHERDTGSPEVQIALLTKSIEELSSHLKKHKKANHSSRGLIQMVADRRTHMKYLQKKHKDRYQALAKKFNLK